MNEAHVALFLSVARTKSFSATANETYTTKQLVSKTIQALEEELGFPLLMRDSHTVTLTEAGEYLRECFLNGSHLLYDNQNRRLLAERKIITVGMDDWLGVPPQVEAILAEYEKTYHCSVRVVQAAEGKVMAMLQSKELDAVIAPRYLAQAYAQVCKIQPLAELELQLQISVDHPKATSENRQHLKEVPFLTNFAGETSLTEVYIRTRNLCQKIGYTPDTITVLPNYSSVITELALGNGITITPRRIPVMNILQFPLRQYASAVFVRRLDNEEPQIEELFQLLNRYWGGGAS